VRPSHAAVPRLAHVEYVPNQRVVGFSKLARVVEHHSRRLQTQERLTVSVADDLLEALDPLGVAVTMEATHLCMTLRGVNAMGTTTVTTAARGLLRDDPATRAEYARVTGRPAGAPHSQPSG
jgi:GTP cyclohydrolase I